MFFRQLNRGACKTYLIACQHARKAALVDPLSENIERYIALLAYFGYRLQAVIDTHTHADFRSGCFEIAELTGAKVYKHRSAPQPNVDVHVGDGTVFAVGQIPIKVLHTPGHTPDSISLYFQDRVLTGDTLLIHGTGRTDLAGGDAGAQYDSITEKLFTLPDETLVFPGHDYRGNTQSTIGEEKRENPRIAGKTREQYVELMSSLGLPLPDKIQEVLQINQTELDDDRVKFPTIAQLSEVRQLDPEEVAVLLKRTHPPLLVDVREEEEYSGELGHIKNSLLIPLRELPNRVHDLHAHRDDLIIAVCRSGIRSTTAAAILTGLGFENVSNLQGGMLAWREKFNRDRAAPT